MYKHTYTYIYTRIYMQTHKHTQTSIYMYMHTCQDIARQTDRRKGEVKRMFLSLCQVPRGNTVSLKVDIYIHVCVYLRICVSRYVF